MYLPHIKNLEKATRQTINVFGGYNHTPVIGENEFYHMENMTSDHYPVLGSRWGRDFLQQTAEVQGMVSSHGLCVIRDRLFCMHGGIQVDMQLSPGETFYCQTSVFSGPPP